MGDNVTANITMQLLDAVGKSQHTQSVSLWLSIIPFLLIMCLTLWEPITYWVNSLKLKMAIKSYEKQTGRKVLVMHHPVEMSMFSFKVPMISLGDSAEIMRFFSKAKPDQIVDMIVHTPGGMVLAAQQIATTMRQHKGQINVYVSNFAMSGGTLLALAADKIYLAKNAVLGSLDPQLSSGVFDQYPACSIVKAAALSNANRDDKTLILADVSQKAIRQMDDYVTKLLLKHMSEDKARNLSSILTSGTWTHDYPITFEKATELGISVEDGLPDSIASLCDKLPRESHNIILRKQKTENSGIRISL